MFNIRHDISPLFFLGVRKNWQHIFLLSKNIILFLPYLLNVFTLLKTTWFHPRFLPDLEYLWQQQLPQWGQPFFDVATLFVCLFQGFLAVVCLSPDRCVSICGVPQWSWHPSMNSLAGAYLEVRDHVATLFFTAKRILERLGIQTSSSFVKIW